MSTPACIVPDCTEPPEYLRRIGDGWDEDAFMCQRHLAREAAAAATIDAIAAMEHAEYDPEAAARIEEDRQRTEAERRARAWAQIDPTKWADPDGSKYGLRALESIIADLREHTAPGSGRNDALSNASYRLGQLVAGGELREDVARDALSWCMGQMAHSPREAREFAQVINRRLRKGMEHPRSAPETRRAAA